MKKIYTSFIIFAFVGLINASLFAAPKSHDNLNDRLRSLQDRLLSFNKSTLAKAKEISETTINVYDQILVIDENFLEHEELIELDSDIGANLIILYHETELIEGKDAPEEKPTINDAHATDRFAELNNNRLARYQELKNRFIMVCSK